MPRFFPRLNRETTANGRKTVEEIFESLVAFQIVEQGVHGYTGSMKHRRAVHDLGISNDRLSHAFIVSQAILRRGRRNYRTSFKLPDLLVALHLAVANM